MTRKLALVIHFHQPVGNLDDVVRNATERCYRPFLETLDRFPDLQMTLHYSGCLLEWLEANASDVTDHIRAMSESGQIELVTGGFYEPILAALPRRDQVGQIRMLTDHLAQRYGADATGLWLTERVWEQEVVGAITEANVRYTILDDTMFHSVGITDDELRGPFVTDHEGRPLLLYAGDRRLRYLIPYKKVARITDYVSQGPEDRLFVYADDGEKFGEWPDTHRRVYEDGWLDAFFAELQTNQDVDVITLGEHAANAVPVGRAYLPSSSYDEMMTWALPSEARLTVGELRRRLQKEDPDGVLPFVRGAPWRAFLAKYPEVNQLQKRMLHVSAKVHDAGAPGEALRELYRAQCNCAYWHGAFGGVYLGFMRSALWHHLMKAESAAGSEPGVEVADLDADANEEVMLSGSWGAAVIAPDEGVLVELDDWRVGANLLAVAARHQEAYHLADENPPEEDEEDDDDEMAASQARSDVDPSSLTFDDRPLGGLVDFVDGDPVSTVYGWELSRDVLTCRTEHAGVRIEKTFTSTADGLDCAHRVTASEAFHGTFAVETAALPLNLGRDTTKDEVTETTTGWKLAQPEAEVNLEVTVEPRGSLTAEPIETASTSLEGLQKMFQGTIVTMSWDLDLAAGETFEMRHVLTPRPEEANLSKKEPGVSA
ncbi:MAG TPA: alpha-amylase/4-alpha-glucanotransferase domain-containing protein [Actinomycetota bacterium]|nr:alpha-amylase/4-alpha-glucanotransferase domain-containing protein [Actinomycetota bacterium]